MPERLPVLLLLLLLQSPSSPEPIRLVREIQAAIDRDGGGAEEQRWQRALAARPRDPGALLAVGTIERNRYRYERSDTLLGALAAYRGPDSVAWRAAGLIGRAAWRALGADVAAADSLLSTARRLAAAAGLRATEAEAVIGLAQIRSRSQGPRAGRQLFTEWWDLLDRPEAVDSAIRICATGGIDEQLGDTTGFARIAEGALIAERIGSWRVAGNCALAMAQSADRRGYRGATLGQANRALRYFRRIDYQPGLALAGQWYGYALVRSARYAQARGLLDTAIIAARRTRFESVEAWARSGLAQLYLEIGDLGRARQQAALAAASHERRGDRWGLANSRHFEAAALDARGELPDAIARYAEAHRAYVAAGLPLNALPSLIARANAELRLGRLDEVERTLATLSEVGKTSAAWVRTEEPILRSALAGRRGDLRAADTLLRKAAGWGAWRRPGPDPTALLLALREALLAIHTNRMATADSALGVVTATFERWRSGAGIEYATAMTQLRVPIGGASHEYPPIVAELVRRGRITTAFEFVEQLRARSIVERRLRAAALVADTTAALGALARGSADHPAATVTALQVSLAPDEAVVSYLLGQAGAPTTAIVVTRDTVAARLLPGRADLVADIERFSQLAAAGTEPITQARRLGDALLAPVLEVLPARVRRLALSADGDLHRVPFDALRLPDGRRALERFTVSTVPSATTLLVLRAQPRQMGARVVAVGDPRYAQGGSAAPRSDGSALDVFRDVPLPRLTYSGDEAARVARYGRPGSTLLRGVATERAVTALDFRNVAVVHFATHAIVDAESQEGTALALTPGADADGFLQPAEIATRLSLHGALVVLSACRSSGGVVLGGEGLRGLTAPLLEAGARAVVGTHWAIGDRTVVPMVDRFYHAMARGLRPDEALRDAKLAAIEAGVSIADWGAFTLAGDASVVPPLGIPPAAPLPWVRSSARQIRRDPPDA